MNNRYNKIYNVKNKYILEIFIKVNFMVKDIYIKIKYYNMKEIGNKIYHTVKV